MKTNKQYPAPIINGEKKKVITNDFENFYFIKDGKESYYVFHKRQSDHYLKYYKDRVEILKMNDDRDEVVFRINMSKTNEDLRRDIANEFIEVFSIRGLEPVRFVKNYNTEYFVNVRFSKDDKGRFIFDIDDDDRRGEYYSLFVNTSDYYGDRAACDNRLLGVDMNTTTIKKMEMNIGYLKDIFNGSFCEPATYFVSKHNIDLDRYYLTRAFFIAFLHLLYDYVYKNFSIEGYLKQKLVDHYLRMPTHFIDDGVKTLYLDIEYKGTKLNNELGATFMISRISHDVAVAGRVGDLHYNCLPVPVYICRRGNKIYRYVGCLTVMGM